MQLADFPGGIQHCVCVCVFLRRIFKINIMFAIPITRENLDLCFTNQDKESSNGYKVLLKAIIFLTTDKISVLFRIKETEIMFDV